jgi:transcriptional regulator with XRE-family HTH domain
LEAAGSRRIVAIGVEIRNRREEQGLSLTDLARLAGVSKGYLSQIEADATKRPSANTLFKIATALGTSIGELVGRDQGTTEALGGTVEVPDSLRALAQEDHLPDAEVRMLAGIRYRGKTPKTVSDWRYIYESIRRSTEGR